jgi:hypothetical protein
MTNEIRRLMSVELLGEVRSVLRLSGPTWLDHVDIFKGLVRRRVSADYLAISEALEVLESRGEIMVVEHDAPIAGLTRRFCSITPKAELEVVRIMKGSFLHRVGVGLNVSAAEARVQVEETTAEVFPGDEVWWVTYRVGGPKHPLRGHGPFLIYKSDARKVGR